MGNQTSDNGGIKNSASSGRARHSKGIRWASYFFGGYYGAENLPEGDYLTIGGALRDRGTPKCDLWGELGGELFERTEYPTLEAAKLAGEALIRSRAESRS